MKSPKSELVLTGANSFEYILKKTLLSLRLLRCTKARMLGLEKSTCEKSSKKCLKVPRSTSKFQLVPQSTLKWLKVRLERAPDQQAHEMNQGVAACQVKPSLYIVKHTQNMKSLSRLRTSRSASSRKELLSDLTKGNKR